VQPLNHPINIIIASNHIEKELTAGNAVASTVDEVCLNEENGGC
jgi:hypothetical protein